MNLLEVERLVWNMPKEFRELYDCEICTKFHKENLFFLNFHRPFFVGFKVNSIKKIEEKDLTFEIKSEGTSVSFWKTVQYSHVSVLE